METNFLMTAFSLTLFVAAVYAGGAAIDNSVKELRKAFLVGLINIILLACGNSPPAVHAIPIRGKALFLLKG